MNNSVALAGIILAAGKGTRMKSSLPKCAQLVCGLPMATHVGRAMQSIGIMRPIVVVGYKDQQMTQYMGEGFDFVKQLEQLGTGHATMMAKDLLKDYHGFILIAPGDVPLIDAEVYNQLIQTALATKALLTFATFIIDHPTGYGRVVRDQKGNIIETIEEKDANAEIKKIKEVSAGVYCIDSKKLFEFLPLLKNENAQGEYYLPDLVKMFTHAGHKVEAVCFEDQNVFFGVNDLWQLAHVSSIMQKKILKKHALAGVSIKDPQSTYIDTLVKIGPETIIEPMTSIEGTTNIGSHCIIGPFTKIKDSLIKDRCEVLMSHLNQATMEKSSRCGPYANLRPNAHLGENAKVGNFVEIKNTQLDADVSVSHLTYLGDAEIGSGTNIGAGTITCNYDGFSKYKTLIGKNVFVGSNTTFIAPIKIGDESLIAAGSVITKNVSEGAMAISRSKQDIRESGALQWRQRKRVGK